MLGPGRGCFLGLAATGLQASHPLAPRSPTQEEQATLCCQDVGVICLTVTELEPGRGTPTNKYYRPLPVAMAKLGSGSGRSQEQDSQMAQGSGGGDKGDAGASLWVTESWREWLC